MYTSGGQSYRLGLEHDEKGKAGRKKRKSRNEESEKVYYIQIMTERSDIQIE
jgi:hypothetical protein